MSRVLLCMCPVQHYVVQILKFSFPAARLPLHWHLFGRSVGSVPFVVHWSKSLSVVASIACYSLTTNLYHVAHSYITWGFPNKVMKCARTKSGLSTNLQDTLLCVLVCVCVCLAFFHSNTWIVSMYALEHICVPGSRLFTYFALIMFYGTIASLWMLLQCNPFTSITQFRDGYILEPNRKTHMWIKGKREN